MAASASSRIGAQRRQRQSLFGANARARRLTDTNAGMSSVEFQHSSSCTTCGMEFDIFNRRHHCRHCGLSFCDTHCRQVAASRVSQSDNLFDDLFEETVRLCEDCISNMRKGVRGLASPDLEALRRRRRRAARRRRRTHQADTGASPNSMGDIADIDDSTSDGRRSFFDSLLSGGAAAFGSNATEAPSESEAAPGTRGAREGIEGGGTGGGEVSSDTDAGGLTNYASRLSALWADNPAEVASTVQNRSLTERIFGPSPNEHIIQATRARAPSDGSSSSPRHERAHSDGGRTDGEGITDGEGYIGEAEGSANESEVPRRESIEDVLSSYAGRLSLLWGSDTANSTGASPSPVASASASSTAPAASTYALDGVTTNAPAAVAAAAATATTTDTITGARASATDNKIGDTNDAVEVEAEAGDTGSHGLAAAAAAFLHNAAAAPATGAAFEPSARAAAALEQQRQQQQQTQQEQQQQERSGLHPRRRRSSTGGDTQLPPGGTLAAISNALSVFSSGNAEDGASSGLENVEHDITATNASEAPSDVNDEAALLREQLRRMQEERDHYKQLHEQNEQTGGSVAQAQAQLLLEREQHAAKQMNKEQEKNRHQLKKLKSLDRRHQEQLSRSATKDLAYALRRQHDFVLRSSFTRWCTVTAQLADQEQELAAAAARQRAARGKAPATLYAHVHAAEFLAHSPSSSNMANDALLSAGEELRIRVTHAESGEVRMSQLATVTPIMRHEPSSNELADDDEQDDETSHRAAFNVAWTASEHASDLAFAFGTTAARGGDTATLLAEVLRPAGLLTDDEDVVATTLLEMPPLEQGESTQAMWVPIFRAAADEYGKEHGGNAALEPAGELLVTVWRELAVERKRQSGSTAAADEKMCKGTVAQLRSTKGTGGGGSLHDLLSPRASMTAMTEEDAERQRSSPRKLRRRAPHALPAPIKTSTFASNQGTEPSSPAAFASWGLAPAAEAAHAVGIGTDSRACDGDDDVLGVGPTPSGRSYSRGSLLVEVRMARGLRDVHALGTQEPYVLAKLCGVGGGSMSHRTRPCAGGGTHPRWSTSHNNRMVFDLRDATRLSRAQARARAKAGEPSKPERPLTLSFELWSLSVAMDTTIGVAQLVLPNDPADLARRGSWFLPVSTGGALEVGVEHVSGTLGSLRLNRVSGAGLSITEPREKWHLCARVLTAHALESVQTFGEQDPYVAAWLESVAGADRSRVVDTQEQRTDARHGTNPTWSAEHANLLEFSLTMDSHGSAARSFDPVVFRVEIRNENLALDDTIGVTHMDFSDSYLQELATIASTADATEPSSPSQRRSSGGTLVNNSRGRASSVGGNTAGGGAESRAHKRVLPIDTGGSLEVAVWLRRVVDADSAHVKVSTAYHSAGGSHPGMEQFPHTLQSDDSDGDGGRNADAGVSGAAQEEAAQAPRVPDWAQHGELELEVTRAKGLKDVQAIGAQDPYIRVHLLPAEGNEVCASLPVSGGGTDPVWSVGEHRAAFTWVLGRDSREQVHSVLVEIWNDNISFDELIGTCLLRLPHERATLGETVWFPVNTGGYLECRIGHTETPQTQLEADTLVVEQRQSMFQSFA